MNERIAVNVRGPRCPFAMVGGANVHTAAFYCLSACHRRCQLLRRYVHEE